MEIYDIQWTQLALAYILIIPAAVLLLYFKTGLVKDLFIAIVRVTVQLILVGVYLKYIFQYNELWINLLWITVMIIVAGMTISQRSNLQTRRFAPPVVLGIITGLVVTTGVIAPLVIGAKEYFNAQYIIPISGMIIGNSLTSSVVGMRAFYNMIKSDKERYMFFLMCGANRNEALKPFIGSAMKEAYNPMIATTATIGVISLPGMMTGQILGGNDPIIAVKYQIMIMLAILAGIILTVFISLAVSIRYAFDEFGLIKPDVFTREK